tara:strand:+ start:366 stop:2111 length:1746 start_codon:yes stop_codon:yes gene_type:complete
MSGIAGVLTVDGSEPPEDLLHALSTRLLRRGKDDQGITIQNGLGLIHRRLSIAPLDAGHQPLCNESKLTLVADCRLLNTESTRDRFADSYDFATALEVETIFPLYEKYGAEFTHHLFGMYAIALYDGHADELILTRDPAGIKPLYYFLDDRYFIFASEIKVLLGLEHIRPDIDRQGRKESLQYGATLGGKTIIHGIKTVLPGETLIVQKGRLLKTFRDRPFDDLKPSKMTLKQSFEEIPAALCEALADLDEPTQKAACSLERPGDYLLASTLDQCYGERTHCFSILLDGESEDSKHQFKVTNLTELPFDEHDFWRTLPFVAAALDEPCNIPERALTYYLAKKLKGHFTVLFSALGTKVLNADMPLFKRAKRLKILGGRPLPRRGIFQYLRDVPLFLNSWSEDIKKARLELDEHSELSRLQKSQVLEYENRFVTQNLASFERLTTFHGLESRFPFLDPKVRYELMGLGDSLKIHHGQTGFAFYELLRHKFPTLDLSSLCHFKRAKLNQWLRNKASRLSALVAHQEEIEAIFSRDFVRDAFSCKDEYYTQAAWTLLMYALWHQAHIKGIKPIPDTLSFLSAKN